MRREAVQDDMKVDIVGKDGGIRHLAIYSNEVFWGGKQQRQITYNDITERQQTEEALKESETRYRELVNNITSGVIIYKAVDNGVLMQRSVSPYQEVIQYHQAEAQID